MSAAGCQACVGGEADRDGGLVGGTVGGGAAGVVFGDGAFDGARADAQPPAGHRVGQQAAADVAGQVDGGAGGDAGGLDELVAGGVQGEGEAGPVGVGAGLGGGGVGHGGAQDLVGDQQGAGLLVHAAGGAGAQDPAAQDGGLQFAVGRFDVPPLVVKRDEFAGRVAVGAGQGGDQPGAGGGAAGLGRDGDLGVDDPYWHAAKAGAVGAVAVAVQGGKLGAGAVGADPDQELRGGGGYLGGQGPSAEVAVG